MFSITRSRLALPVQFLFLIVNGFGVVFGTIFNVNTTDLYKNNAHHKIGWIATWVITAQVIMGLIFIYSGWTKESPIEPDERAAFLPVSIEAMTQHHQFHSTQGDSDYRWSGDSGQGTEPASSSSSHSRDMSPSQSSRREDYQRCNKPEAEDSDDEEEEERPERRGLLRIAIVHQFLSRQIPGLFSKRLLRVLEVAYKSIDRTILILGFIALTTGGVTYAGIFVRYSTKIFSIKKNYG